MSAPDPLAQTRAWVTGFVVGLDLCPFAAGPLGRGAVRFVRSRATAPIEVLAELSEEIARVGEGVGETSLLVIPSLFEDFEDFLDFVAAAEDWLALSGLEGEYQLASFHPDYCFASAAPDDPANATNRSPYPTLHLLRWADVARAAASHPDIAAVPRRNAALLRGVKE